MIDVIRLACETRPRVHYPGMERIEYDVHPFSPRCFVGTPAEGRVPGEDRMGWLGIDWCGNVVGVEEADWIACPWLPGTRLEGRTVAKVALVRHPTVPDCWEWEVTL